MPYNQRKYFTLIELLTVMSIIALLTALLLPALKKIKDQTEQQYCKNMMKERRIWGIGYENDNNNNITPCSSSASIQDFWYYHLKSYSGMNEALFREEGVSCPGDPNPNRPFTDSPPTATLGPYKMSVLYNAYFGQDFPHFIKSKQRKTTDILEPSSCGVMIDGHIDSALPTSRGMPWMVRWGMVTWMVEFRHSGTTNILYFDGHADSYSQIDIDEMQPLSTSMGKGM